MPIIKRFQALRSLRRSLLQIASRLTFSTVYPAATLGADFDLGDLMRRVLSAVAGILAFALIATGCASTVRIGGPEHSCSPGFEPSNEFGSITAQQRGRGFGVQWGVYPKIPAASYTVDIFINNWRIDHKEQGYPPHGSVPASNIGSGDIFRLEGQATNAKGDVAFFYLTCKSA